MIASSDLRTTTSRDPAGAARRSSHFGCRGAARHGFAYHTQSAARERENFDISALPQDALDEINRIQTRQRLNTVVKTSVPGFIPQGS
jgi:hypothetical protein